MKKVLALLLSLVLVMTFVTGCNNTSDENTSSDFVSSDVSSDVIEFSSEEPVSSDIVSDVSSDDYYYEEVPEEDPYAGMSEAEKTAAQIQLGENVEFLQAGIAKDANGQIKGNKVRAANFIRKLQAGQAVNIVTFGGTNVEASDNYGTRIVDWALNYGGGSDVNYFPSGLPMIPSDQAVYRVKHDVISKNPDLVILDFAVQDAIGGGAKSRSTAFENIVRRILAETKACVIVLIGSGAEQNSYDMLPTNCDPIATASKYHTEVADYYDLPIIDFNEAVWDVISTVVEKKYYGEIPLLNWDFFSNNNNVQLGSVGMTSIANMITTYFDGVAGELNKIGTNDSRNYDNLNDPATYLYKNNSYITGDYIDFVEMVDKTTHGYRIVEDSGNLTNTGGDSWTIVTNATQANGNRIQAYRPADADGNSVPFTVELPSAVKETNKISVLYGYAYTAADKGVTTQPQSPIRIVSYDKDGNVLSSTKPSISIYRDAKKCNRTGALYSLPEGTVKVTFECYVSQGTIYFYGLTSQQAIS